MVGELMFYYVKLKNKFQERHLLLAENDQQAIETALMKWKPEEISHIQLRINPGKQYYPHFKLIWPEKKFN
jgi:hypothetical protein